MSKIIFPISWAELTEILKFLGEDELMTCRKLCRFGFVHIYTRETYLRQAPSRSSTIPRLLPRLLSHERIALVSYPRSGNSFLRRLLESDSGLVTGSDSRVNRKLCASLLKCGFSGEGIVDSSVWMVKTHYPERMGYLKFRAQRIVLLVRNPWDSLESYFHMGLTNTHDKAVHPEVFSTLLEIWNEYILSEAKVWNDFHQFWLKIGNTGLVPIKIIRYEDLLLHPEETMSELHSFLSEGNIQACDTTTAYAWRHFNARGKSGKCQNGAGNIAESCQVISTNPSLTNEGFRVSTYTVKKGGVGKSMSKFSDAQAAYVSHVTKECRELFGYDLEFGPEESSGQFLRPLVRVKRLMPITFCSQVMPLSPSTSGADMLPNFGINENGIMINEPIAIRASDDKFGRLFSELRCSLTDNDKVPLRTN